MTPSNPFSEGQVVKRDYNRLGNYYMQKGGPETGEIIPICNGENSGKCIEFKDFSDVEKYKKA